MLLSFMLLSPLGERLGERVMQETLFGLTLSPNLSRRLACGNCGNWFAQLEAAQRRPVRLPKGQGPFRVAAAIRHS